MSSERTQAERSPDLLDRASALTQQLNDASVNHARAMARPEQARNQDGSWPHTECVDCGLDIEAGRLSLGKIRCFSCQSDLERRNRFRR